MATKVSAPFPDVILAPGTTITVTMDDANAKITKLNVYGISPVNVTTVSEPAVPPLFVYSEAS